MSIAITQVKLHFSTQDQNFKFAKVCGPLSAIVPPDGNTIDIELRELCHGEKKEILIEMELLTPGSSHESQDAKGSDDDDSRAGDWPSENGRLGSGSTGGGGGSSVGMQKSASGRSFAGGRSKYRESVSASDANHLGDAMFGASAAIEEVPCLELDCSFFDPLCSKSCTRLARPILLQLTLLPHTNGPLAAAPETVVVRRRMELLASDMISRALIFISKTRSFDASLNLLEETRGVLKGKVDDLIEQIGRDSMHGYAKSAKKAARDALNRENLSALEAIMLDIGMLVEAFDEDSWVDFNREQKNFGAQQVRRPARLAPRPAHSTLVLTVSFPPRPSAPGHDPPLAARLDAPVRDRAPLLYFRERHRPRPPELDRPARLSAPPPHLSPSMFPHLARTLYTPRNRSPTPLVCSLAAHIVPLLPASHLTHVHFSWPDLSRFPMIIHRHSTLAPRALSPSCDSPAASRTARRGASQSAASTSPCGAGRPPRPQTACDRPPPAAARPAAGWRRP